MRGWFWIALAVVITLPGLIVRFVALKQVEYDTPLWGAFLFGLSVIGAAFLLAWATEAAQADIPKALALSVMALIAVLPEYAVDFALTYQAGSDPAYQQFAVANMIGANRMIVGFAWPLLVFIFAFKFKERAIRLGQSQRVEIGFLLIAGFYSLILPIKGRIDFVDFAVFVGLFILYSIRLIKSEVHEPELVGPAQLLGALSRPKRITAVSGMILFAGVVIFLVAHPFAVSLIETGTRLGVDEVFLLQWFAPLASEAPEIVICIIFTLRYLANEGLGALVASKVNQWTLLVGTLPLVFSLGSGYIRPLPLSGTFVENGLSKEFNLVGPMLVTSAQTLLAVMVIINLRMTVWGALLLFGLLMAQFFVPNRVGAIDSDYLFAGIYLAASLGLALLKYRHFVPTFRSMVSPAYVKTQIGAEDKEALSQAPN
jgi:cation:H+ antiporter